MTGVGIGVTIYLAVNLIITYCLMTHKHFDEAYEEAGSSFSKTVVAIALMLFGLPAMIYSWLSPDDD